MDGTMPKIRPRFIELCCGAGGMTLGFIQANWDCVFGLDNDKDACETFVHNLQVPAIRASVHDVSFHTPVDALVAGFPCVSHSLSGKRRGLADPRGQVVYGVLRIAKEILPRFLVFENVPGLISSPDADGEKGGALSYIVEEMMALGYTVEYDVLDSNDYGIGQKRNRLFIVGAIDGQRWVKPPPDEEKRVVYDELFDLLGEEVDLPNHEKMKHRSDTEIRLADLKPGESLYANFSESWKRLSLDAPAPTQKENHGGLNVHPLEPRCITAREMARLQGFPDDFEFLGSKSSVLQQIGNAVPVPLARAVAASIISLMEASNGS